MQAANARPGPWHPGHLALFVAALCWFSLGIGLTLEWVDEGQIIYPIWRTAAGAVPYRDFGHAYWPGLFLANGLLLRIFGDDLAVVRAGLVVVKAVLALEVYLLARALARPWIASMAWALVLAVWGAPVWVFNAPYANHYTLAFGLGAACLLTRVSGRSVLPALLGGLLVGVATTFKHTTGAFLVAACGTFLAAELGAVPARRVVRALVLLGAASVVVVYAGRATQGWTTVTLAAPALAVVVGMAGERRASGSARLRDLLAFGVGVAVPVLGCFAGAAWMGLLSAFVTETLTGFGAHVTWAMPLPIPDRRLLVGALAVAACMVAVGASGAPRWIRGLATVVAIGSVAGLRTRHGVTMSLVHWMPIVVPAVAVVGWAVGRGVPDAPPATRRAFWLALPFAAFVLLTLHPAADLPHALMILPATLPLLAGLVDRFVGAGATSRGRLATVGIVVGTLLMAWPFLVELRRARAGLSDAAPHFARATGIRQADARTRDVARVIERLDALAPPGAPMAVLPNAQTLYVLAGRPSVIERDEFALYLLVVGILDPEATTAVLDDAALVRRLEDAAAPIVVDDTEPGIGRLRVALPRLARFLDTELVCPDRIGSYRICRVRAGSAS